MDQESNAVADDGFGLILDRHDAWRRKLANAIEYYRDWASSQMHFENNDELRLLELTDELRNGALTVAVVGEVSRGKTELINALFFADHDR